MNRSIDLLPVRAALCSLLAALALPAFAAEGSLAQVAWLAGCWQADGGEAGSVEQWMAPAGGAMLGMGRTVKAGRMSTFEFMQIREAATGGGIEFHAMPAGQAPATFPAKAVSDAEVTFENPAHDFPQRVVYAADGPSRLKARIEGTLQGRERVVRFPMARVACDSATPAPAAK
jgi:hypothetical protein